MSAPKRCCRALCHAATQKQTVVGDRVGVRTAPGVEKGHEMNEKDQGFRLSPCGRCGGGETEEDAVIDAEEGVTRRMLRKVLQGGC